MSEDTTNGSGAQPAVGETADDQLIQVGVLAQYVKDLSFENPGAPASLQKLGEVKPQIDVGVNVNARRVADDRFEVDLQITAKALQDNDPAFLVELLYSGIFAAVNMPDEALQPFLLIECPRILFPFARRIIADVTRDGGFPPLLLEPIDFATLYRQHLAQAQAEAQKEVEGHPNQIN
ncbi:protein-export chaperone SecB [Govanella unica]|uniref:Protein-export protein SecB n=1 Tax=Govanella unica TaxID=2975056 RepID=A0A9X3TUP0_9PROT|nr:protein-export chaperone SecB [Govania unica]MDA5192373.1 protein-export chaperone SecB [Govania unica]